MRALALGLLVLLTGPPGTCRAQDELVVLVVDPGETRVNPRRLEAAIERSTRRSIIRMTDERAPSAHGRLTIAFSRPNRWVLRYEAGGQVAWVSDRITRPGELRRRLAELSRGLITMVDGDVPARRPEPSADRGGPWGDDVVLALQDELIDPFADDPPRRPVTVLWSEVIDPFTDQRASRATVGEVWSDLLDPWSTEPRRGR